MYNNIMNTKTNNIDIDLSDYSEAIEKSLYDQDWVRHLYTDSENLMNVIKENNPNAESSIEAIEFCNNPNIKTFANLRSKDLIDYNILETIMDAGNFESNIKFANRIKNKTIYNIELAKSLVNEYSANTREFFYGRIAPFPESVEDTWKPITTFKLTLDNHDDIVIKIDKSKITTNNSHDKFYNYFENRNKSKDIKRMYLNENQITKEQYKKCRKDLIVVKESKLYVTCASEKNETSKYKILYKGNQTLNHQNIEIALFNPYIKVYQIMEV